jgi:hypothetical protein
MFRFGRAMKDGGFFPLIFKMRGERKLKKNISKQSTNHTHHYPRRFYKRRADVVFAIYIAVVRAGHLRYK